MERYECHNCHERFDRPHMAKGDRYEFWGAYEYMYYDVCPVCGSEDFEEIKELNDYEEDSECE